MPKFRKKPVVIDALQWTGANVQELTNFLAGFEVHIAPPNGETECRTCIARFDYTTTPPSVTIPTLDGDHRANAGDWIIRGIKGEFYPCKPDIFEATYEAVGLDILDILDILKPVAAVAIAQQLQATPSTLVELAALRRFRDQIMSLRAEVGVIAENTTPGPDDKDILAEFAKRIDALFQQSPVDIRGTPISEVPPEVSGC